MATNFETLVKRISPTLKKITYRLNGHSSFFNDEDLYQEALIRLWQDFKKDKLQDKTDSYILQGCYFHLKNYLRKMRPKTRSVSLESLVTDDDGRNIGETLLLEVKDTQSDIDRLDNKLLVETIRNNGFSPREKRMLYLYGQGLTTRAIGERLGVSHVRVIKMMREVKDKCRKYSD